MKKVKANHGKDSCCFNYESPLSYLTKLSNNNRWGYYLNCGSGSYSISDIYEGVSPTEYGNIVRESYVLKPFFVGSCCGSTPLHTKVIKDVVYAENNN